MGVDCIIGIDPGGGCAMWRSGAPVEVVKMPADLMDLRPWFERAKLISSSVLVFVEKVSLRHDDVNANPAKAFRIQGMLSAFQKLQDILVFEEIPYILVHPRSWQSYNNLWTNRENPVQVLEVVERILAKRRAENKSTSEDQLSEINERAAKQVRKNRYAENARSLYPGVKVTLWNADAIQLMHFGRRKLANDPAWIIGSLPKSVQQKIRL